MDCSVNEEQEKQLALSPELNLKLLNISKDGDYNKLKEFLE